MIPIAHEFSRGRIERKRTLLSFSGLLRVLITFEVRRLVVVLGVAVRASPTIDRVNGGLSSRQVVEEYVPGVAVMTGNHYIPLSGHKLDQRHQSPLGEGVFLSEQSLFRVRPYSHRRGDRFGRSLTL